MIVSAAPKVDDAVRAFLGAWESENYDAMYQQLSAASKQAITAEDFSLFYKETAISMNLQTLKTEFVSDTTNPSSAAARFKAKFRDRILWVVRPRN